MGLTWQQLAALRAKGMKPGTPVVLAQTRVGRAMWECLPVIAPGDKPPVSLLRGLDVLLMDGCAPARETVRGLKDAGVRCNVLSWCERDKTLGKFYGSCECRT